MSQAVQDTFAGNIESFWVSLYEKLAASSERLSTNLWVKFADEDTSAFDIRELMRADIASLKSALYSQHAIKSLEHGHLEFDPRRRTTSCVPPEYPNVDYSFACSSSHTASAQILTQTYVINRFTFLGDFGSFEFKDGKPVNKNEFYPGFSLLTEHRRKNQGSYFSTFALSLDKALKRDIEYTIQFDSDDYVINGLSINYTRVR